MRDRRRRSSRHSGGTFPPPEPPDAPVATAATNVTASSFSANWNTASGADNYRLDISTVSNFASFITGYSDRNVGNVTTFAVSGVTAGTYYIRVRASNSDGDSASSNTITVQATDSVPVDVLLDFEFGSGGSLATPAGMNASQKGAALSWAFIDHALDHTTIVASNSLRTTPLSIGGVVYTGAGSRSIQFDHSAWTGAGYDGLVGTLPSPTLKLVATGVSEFSQVGAGNIDHFYMLAGPYLVLQQTNGGGDIHIETSIDGTYKGQTIPIEAGQKYYWELRYDAIALRAELALYDVNTLELIGTSGVTNPTMEDETVIAFRIQDYLNPTDGVTIHDSITLDWTNGRFPLETVTIPDPTGLQVDQTGESTVRFVWGGVNAMFYTIQRQVNGGAWTTISSVHYPEENIQGKIITDTDLSDGDTVKYRVRGGVGTALSNYVESDELTINDNPEGFDVQWQGQTGIFDGSPAFNTGAGEYAAQKIKGVHTSDIGISKVIISVAALSAGHEGNVRVQLADAADGSGTIYGTSADVAFTDSTDGEVEFEFFVPVVIPANTDFYIRVVGDFPIIQFDETLDVAGYLPGQGYDFRESSGDLYDLYFKLFVKYTPVAPTGVSVEQTAAAQVTIEWTDTNSALTRYGVDQWVDGVWTNLVTNVGPGVETVNITGLTDDETYNFRVYAYIAGEVGSESSKVSTGTITIDAGLFPDPVWYRTCEIVDATGNHQNEDLMEWQKITLPNGTAKKLGIGVTSAIFSTATSVKLGLFDSGGNRLAQVTLTGVGATTGWFEGTVADTVITSGDYYIGIWANPFGQWAFGKKAGSGNQFSYSFAGSYAAAMPSTLPTADVQTSDLSTVGVQMV